MIQRENVSELIVKSVIEKIRTKQLLPGDKLPNEKDMSEEYGVSRISLREALRYLSAKGLIVTRHGEGSFINTYDPSLVADTLYTYSLLTTEPVLEMLELRKIMEAQACRLCAQNASDEEIAQIIEYKNKREAECQNNNNPTEKFKYDRLFHLAIAKGSHNEIFEKFIETIHLTIEIHQLEYTKTTENIKHTTNYHNKISEALTARNAELAGQMMYEHIDQIKKTFGECKNQ